jgi:filamentous hemagglutinin family protein
MPRATRLKPLFMAVSLTLVPASVYASTLPSNTLPANGSVISGQISASVSGSTMNIVVSGSQAVVDWGTAGGSIDTVSGAGGFDVGSGATVVLSSSNGNPSNVLNIDISGNPSEIDGTILGNNVGIYVANANGILVTPTATVSAPDMGFAAVTPSNALNLLDLSSGKFSLGGAATGSITLATGATINGDSVLVAGNGIVNIGSTINVAGEADLYGEANITGVVSANVVNVNGGFYGSGTITANMLNVKLTGYVNDNKTGQILANGFTLDAGNSGTMNISLTAYGSQSQGFNTFINGNANINTGLTEVSATAPNINSRLIVQASGTLVANPGNQPFTLPGSSTADPAMDFPGLIYLLGSQGLSVNAAVNNAYTVSAPPGYGIFLLGPSVNDNLPIAANGQRGINIESTDYGPTTINGTNITLGVSPVLPLFLFLESGSNGAPVFTTPAAYTTAWAFSAPGDVFLASPSYTGPLYPVNQPPGQTQPSSLPTSLNIASTTLPENGKVVMGSASDTISNTSMAISLSSSNGFVVILWGSSAGATLNPSSSTGGFDIGSAASVHFGYPTTVNSGPGSVFAVLNVDVSGNPSIINGALISQHYADGNEYFANANGIILGPNAAVTNENPYNEVGFFAIPVDYGNLSSQGNYISNIIQYPQSGSIDVYPGATFSDDTIFAGSNISYGGALPALGDATFMMTGVTNSVTMNGIQNADYLFGPALSIQGLNYPNEQQTLDLTINGSLNIGSSALVSIGGRGLNVFNVSGSGSIIVGSGFLNIQNYTGTESALLTNAKAQSSRVSIATPVN